MKHDYSNINCITLIQAYYKNELGIDLCLPKYDESRAWLKQFTVTFLDNWANQYGKKVLLTEVKNYEIMAFRSKKTELLTHFAMFIMPYKMLHVEEGRSSTVELLSDKWLDNLHGIYRHNALV